MMTLSSYPLKRVSVSLPEDFIDTIKHIAKEQDTSFSDMTRRLLFFALEDDLKSFGMDDT